MEKKVVILLSTYNGEKYLAEQLDSLINQTYKNLHILIRDDGSSDSTREILSSYSKNNSNITVVEDRNIGVKKSFFQLLEIARNKGDYFAFCDQDDVWLPEKIEKAILQMEKISSTNVLYCSTLNLVGKDLSFIKKTKTLIPDKSNAMIQNIVTGCTMIINKNLAKLVLDNEPNWKNTEMHDSWFYLVASFKGKVIFDDNSYIYYRQHGNNEVGLPTNKLEVIKNSVYGFQKEKNTKIHRKQLTEFYNLFNENLIISDKKMIEKFLFNDNFIDRIKALKNTKVFKQSKSKTIVFYLMYIIKYI